MGVQRFSLIFDIKLLVRILGVAISDIPMVGRPSCVYRMAIALKSVS